MTGKKGNQLLLSIGALARASGISVTTLRNWERRYHYPRPRRLESGHRRYPSETVKHLRLIGEALERGFKPSTVVGLGEEELRRLLADTASGEPPIYSYQAGREVGIWLAAVERLNADALERGFYRAWAAHGAGRFVTELAVPFMHEVGERWSRRDMIVMHEHFASELLGGFLAIQLRSLAILAHGPRAVLATLPGERHDLGLQMAAVLFAGADFDPVYLGANMPLDQIGSAARQANAAVVLIGSSIAAGHAQVCQAVESLRRDLPMSIGLAIGGSEQACRTSGVSWLASLPEAETWARQLRATLDDTVPGRSAAAQT